MAYGSYAPDTEAALTACLLIYPNSTDEILQKVSDEDIHGEIARKVFGLVRNRRSQGKAVDAIIASSILDNDADARQYVIEAAQLVASDTLIPEYIKIVKEKTALRKIQDIGTALAYANQYDFSSVSKALEELNKLSVTASNSLSITPNGWRFLYMREEQKVIDNPLNAAVRTGYEELDDPLGGGLQKSGLYILAARPGVGKTTFGVNLAERVVERGDKVLFVSLEMSARQMMSKRVSSVTDIEYPVLMSGKMSKETQREMWKAVDTLASRPMYLCDRPGLTVADVASVAQSIPDLKLIIVDHLNLIQPASPAKSRYEDYTVISGELKRLAMSMDIPVLVMAQLNRAFADRKDKKPQLSDLRDSGAIEQDADGVLMLHRGSYFDGQKGNEEKIDIIVAKNRHGSSPTISMIWDGSHGRVTEIREEDKCPWEQ